MELNSLYTNNVIFMFSFSEPIRGDVKETNNC